MKGVSRRKVVNLKMNGRRSAVKSNADTDSQIHPPTTSLPVRNLLKCDKCDRSFANRKYLLKHNKGHRNLESSAFVCGFCSKKFTTERGLSLHISIHTNEKLFSCHLCNKGFYYYKDLNIHMVSHQTERAHQCDKCDKNYKLKKHLTRHLKTHDPNYKYTATRTNPTREVLPLYPCGFCGKTFTKGNLLNHTRTHTKERPYACLLCSKRFAQQAGLDIHVQSVHLRKTFKCEYCDKELSGITSLKYHTMIHKGEFDFKCETCGKQFRGSQNLSSHQLTHNTVKTKPWVCKLCNKTFTRQCSVTKHQRLKNCTT